MGTSFQAGAFLIQQRRGGRKNHMKPKYIIVRATTLEALQNEVNEKIKFDYRPWGGMAVGYDFLAQTMMLNESDRSR